MSRSNSLNSLLIGLAAVATLITAGGGHAYGAEDRDDHAKACSVHSLKGGYALTLTGKAAGYGDINGVGRADLDGEGKFTGHATGMAAASSVGTVFSTPIHGSYTLKHDCTGTFTVVFDNLYVSVEGEATYAHDATKGSVVMTSPLNVQLTGTVTKQ